MLRYLAAFGVGAIALHAARDRQAARARAAGRGALSFSLGQQQGLGQSLPGTAHGQGLSSGSISSTSANPAQQAGSVADGDVADRLAAAFAGEAACQERACSTTRDLFTAFTTQFGAQQHQQSWQQQQQQQQQLQRQQLPEVNEQATFWFYEDEMPCPPDVLDLGRATWTLLHSVAAYYPIEPSQQVFAWWGGCWLLPGCWEA
jgi:hypothetical protein